MERLISRIDRYYDVFNAIKNRWWKDLKSSKKKIKNILGRFLKKGGVVSELAPLSNMHTWA